MRLDGSCHCGQVRFRVETAQPYPYQRCYCSICRKTAGGGGFAINLSADAASLRVRGAKHLRVYRALLREPGQRTRRSPGQRHFCGGCGSALWLFDPRWPELLHPFASAIDTALPVPPEHTHLMLDAMPDWVEPHFAKADRRFREVPAESIAEWHDRLGLTR